MECGGKDSHLKNHMWRHAALLACERRLTATIISFPEPNHSLGSCVSSQPRLCLIGAERMSFASVTQPSHLMSP